MDINLTAFKRTRSIVMSVQYAGVSVDGKLFASFRKSGHWGQTYTIDRKIYI